MAATETSMELIYTNQLGGFEPGKRYRVASLFRSVERGVTEVIVIGDHPEIVAAYESAGADVTIVEAPLTAVVSAPALDLGELEGELSSLHAEAAEISLLIEGLGAGEIHRPESGNLALRLFDALGVIHGSIGELTTERNGLLSSVDALRLEIEELKKAAIAPLADDNSEVDTLKARLDEAKVRYRANASKESLEKLVAELPQA